jgi:fumarate reductase flavoprotein subunit
MQTKAKVGRQILAGLLAIILVISFCGCGSSNTESTAQGEEEKTEQTYTGTSTGFGGEITVTLTVDSDNVIIKMEAEGKDETESIGGVAIEKFNSEIFPDYEGKGVAEVNINEIDTVSSASYTTAGVKRAATEALNAAQGIEAGELQIPDGTYEGSASGFHLGTDITVTVTVKDGWISNVEYGENGETAAMWNIAVETADRAIEAKSLAVDAVAGATVSGNGIKAAIEDALVNGAGVDANLLYSTVEKSNAVVQKGSPEDPYNILVVGFGGSGMTAALSAIQHTDKVIAIEMNGKLGGNTSTASGPMGINPQSKVSLNGGLMFEDEEDLLADWLAYTTDSKGVQDANEEIVADLIYNGGATNDWLENNGFSFGNPTSFLTRFVCSQSFNDYALDHVAVTEDFNYAADIFENLGGELMMETKGTGYIQNEAGDVIGVTAVGYDGTTYEIYAKAVIEATGGFGGSDTMQEEYLGGVYKVYGMQNCDGVMMQAAIDLGADTQNIGMPPMSHFTAPYISIDSFEDVAYTTEGLEGTYSPNDIIDAILINGVGMDVTKEGQRFYPETSVDMEAWQAGDIFYSVINQGIIDELEENGLATAFTTILGFRNQGTIAAGEPLTMIQEVIDAGIAAGEIIKADTIEELADLLNIDADILKDQLAVYNQYCADGIDPDFGKDPAYLTAMEEGPYYAVIGAAWIYSTVGGLKVDTQMRVVDTDGNVISGLYAVGTDSMGVLMNEEEFYLGYGGVAMGYVFHSGRTAGLYAAQYAAGWEEVDVTADAQAAVSLIPALEGVEGAEKININTQVVQVSEDGYELTGYAEKNSEINTEMGFAEGSGVVAVAAEAAGTTIKNVTSVMYNGTATQSAQAYAVDGKLVILQPITKDDIVSSGIIVTVTYEDGTEQSITLFIGTLYIDDLDDCLTEETGISGITVYRTGDFTYTVEGAHKGDQIYVASPAPQTTFVSATITSINGVATEQVYTDPGEGISFELPEEGGTTEITVDWYFEVPTLDVWTMTFTNVPYTNTVTYTFIQK